ncbi:bifunctional DNA-binding transcriptional regulator/O6-methylguanine-DNA methyltransferase Ada [Methylophilus sp. UBA6697]|uniref:bifunctional DNA-binding transcriptional regulator/O6-methylguanine-DNA methyltransferase Ada n=1 Tax=Methylophilus sp. UBA6697 TaxID=1946902 RepID=UPI000EC95565|nr:bifunctional DNA-binding transcriptional regulator/O6-methylguanine-DNA methyltransferase Ada [Methylophilus sp. UBA6697]HCU85014.1 bifunctional DNA-binding transcriptional regulator/O6-methylguanine-DNA methyltransferase Ada [Methylophilus sp.]
MAISSSIQAQQTLSDPRWQQVVVRDAQADGSFFYSVKTTGVYCRPSCGARQARPENVAFHATIAAAEAAGFRPCKRCKPNQAALADIYAEKIALACRLIDAAETSPSLTQLAEHAGLSRFHFHRVFKAVTGLTPKAYVAAHKAQRLRQQLDVNMKVTDAIYEAGYGSSSRFYEASSQALGMQPTQYVQGGKQVQIHFAVAQCSLGAVLVARSAKGVCAISMGDDAGLLLNALQDRFPAAVLIGGDADFEAMIASVLAFIESPKLGLNLPLDIQGTVFQRRVWQALREIPSGETVTYSMLAERIGMPKAVRAVASACAANTLAVAIPCHRVIRQDGSLSGYRWGVVRKQALLTKEAAD